MSGSKTDSLEIERLRRIALEKAMKHKKEIYDEAYLFRHVTYRKIDENLFVMKTKIKALKDDYSEFSEVNIATENLLALIKKATAELERFKEEDIPPFEIEKIDTDERCYVAEQINSATHRMNDSIAAIVNQINAEEKKREDKKARLNYEKQKREAILCYEKQKKEAEAMLKSFTDGVESIENENKNESAVRSIVYNIRSIKENAVLKARSRLDATLPDTPERIRMAAKSLIPEISTIINSSKAGISQHVKELDLHYCQADKMNSFLQSIQIGEVSELSSDLISMSDDEFSEKIAPDLYDTMQKEAKEKYNSVLEDIFSALCNDSVSNADNEALIEIWNRLSESKSEAELMTLIHEAEMVLNRANIAADEFDAEYCRYLTACNALKALYENLYSDDFEISILDKADFTSIRELTAENERLENILIYENERQYIRSCIDEVMKKFGYCTSQEFVLHGNTDNINVLCESENGEDGIHIFFGKNSDGTQRIMMEVVGTTTEKIISENDDSVIITNYNEMSDLQKDKLLKKQQEFCQIHPEIIKELEKMGVKCEKIRHNPPGHKYCKSISVVKKSSKSEYTTAQAQQSRSRRVRNARYMENYAKTKKLRA